MSNKQPEAIRLADDLETLRMNTATNDQAAAELRRLHTVNQQWEKKAATWLASPEAANHAFTIGLMKADEAWTHRRLLEIMRRNGLATGHGDTLKQVIDTLEVELTDVLSAARQNAARYRWLRDVSDTEFMEELSDTFFGEWDAVIDAAMQQEQT